MNNKCPDCGSPSRDMFTPKGGGSSLKASLPDDKSSEINRTLLNGLPDRNMISRFFDDGVVVVGWKDTREILLTIGSNTDFNRELGDFIVNAVQNMKSS